MKKLLTLTTLVFTVMFSSICFGDWTKVDRNVGGGNFYVDFERIKQHDGYVYFWELVDFEKPLKGVLSVKTYNQVDCNLFRHKTLSWDLYKEQMGQGDFRIGTPPDEWDYPPPNSSAETVLQTVCRFVKNGEWKWTKVSTDGGSGNTVYVDFDRIRKHDGYVYFWNMFDLVEPDPWGHFSTTIYNQGDCKLFRFKRLSWSFHKEPMGGGTGETDNRPDEEWTYPPPDPVDETVLKTVCEYFN